MNKARQNRRGFARPARMLRPARVEKRFAHLPAAALVILLQVDVCLMLTHGGAGALRFGVVTIDDAKRFVY